MARRSTYPRRPYQRGPSLAPWIVSAVVAAIVVVAIVMVLGQQPEPPDPGPKPEDEAVVRKRLEAEAAQAKEQQREHGIRVLRQKLKRIDKRIASTQEFLKDKWAWGREKHVAEAERLAAEREQVVAELKALGAEP